MDSLYALEYQEESGNFHYNQMTGIPQQNTVGYRTIEICSFDKCSAFSQAMHEKYNFDKSVNNIPPTFDLIKREWDEYTKSVTPK